MKKTVEIVTESINLDALLKWANLVGSGGEAKAAIQGGQVSVNGAIDTRRQKKIVSGDIVSFNGTDVQVVRK